MVGLILGDSAVRLPSDSHPLPASQGPEGPAVGTALGQLACYTVEGLIRGFTRADERGICDLPMVVSLAYCRWARRQGLRVNHEPSEWEGRGWLADVAPLDKVRGTAPATATAVERGFGRRDARGGTSGSSGHHALTRTAPLALFTWPAADGPYPAEAPNPYEAGYRLESILEWAADLAALTHGDPAAWDAAVAGVLLLACCLRSDSVAEGRSLAQSHGARCSPGVAELLAGRGAAPENTASAAFLAGVAAAEAASQPGEALTNGRQHGAGSATFAGALAGAASGLSQLGWPDAELGWIADRLAQDALRQCREHPALGGDPLWQTLYPPN